jgi:hypothetical protein
MRYAASPRGAHRAFCRRARKVDQRLALFFVLRAVGAALWLRVLGLLPNATCPNASALACGRP